MDVAVGEIDRRAGECARALRLPPQRRGADLVDDCRTGASSFLAREPYRRALRTAFKRARRTRIWTNQVFIPTRAANSILEPPGRTALAQRPMLTHAQIWTALDRLAARAGLSASGLAKKAGLDPTTFNKSKRITPDGRPRWPSTELIAKALRGDRRHDRHFRGADHRPRRRPAHAVPVIGFAEAGAGGYFDDGGFPAGKGWDEIPFPAVNDEQTYALEVRATRCSRSIATATSSFRRLADPPRRPRRGQNKGRRGHGQGVEAPHRQDARAAPAQTEAQGAHARRWTTWLWIARIIWASQ